jgi:hypothetical protein
MGEQIEMELDQQGRLVLSSPVANRLGLTPGTRLVVEKDAANVALRIQSEQPRLVDKGGVLVVEPDNPTSFEDPVQREREQRILALIQGFDGQ